MTQRVVLLNFTVSNTLRSSEFAIVGTCYYGNYINTDKQPNEYEKSK
jgi:hypothetical protein